MYDRTFWARPLYYPKTSLVVAYTVWKLLLACIAICSPGLGYDTSTSLLYSDENVTQITSWSDWVLKLWLRNLTRWDAIYFTQIARRGYVWEQEWAFGWGFTKLISFAVRILNLMGYRKSSGVEALAGVILSHISHLLSVLILHELTLTVYHVLCQPKRCQLAVVAASLHIISPAGMFLSAPYAESSFSFFNFFGFYCYAQTLEGNSKIVGIREDMLIVVSGIAFGVATTFRGNGLFSGLILVYDAIACTTMILGHRNVQSSVRRLFVTCISGTLMACIAVVPQYLAYAEYCSAWDANKRARPWCSGWFPSIYGWVQEEYWGVGIFGYWTISNLPLFLLAAPMLYILLHSGLWAWYGDIREMGSDAGQLQGGGGVKGPQVSSVDSQSIEAESVAFRYAVPQIILAVLALTTYHVQIITRISSGYPVWYWWLASFILKDHKMTCLGTKVNPASLTTRWMVIYALVQGGLFAGFLPPA